LLFVTIGLTLSEIMKFIRSTVPFLFLFCLLVLILSGCGAFPQPEGTLESTSLFIKTISPATLTALSEMEAPSQTPEPDPMGIAWSDLEGQEVEFWYVSDLDEPGSGMNAIVDRFNRENQWGINVIPQDRGLVLDPLASVESALEEGLTPHIMVGEASVIAGWYLSGLTEDLNPFMNDPAAGMIEGDQRAFYPGVFSEFILDGSVRSGIPFSQSIQVIYYNESWAKELGFNSLPVTVEDYWEQSCSPAGEGEPAGLVLSPQAANILSFIYAYRGDPFVSVDEGYLFSTREIREFAGDWRGLSLDGCGQLISNYPNPMAIEGEYERFNQREALMIMGSSLIQEHIQMGPGQTGRADDWKMLPFLGPDGTKVVTSEVQSIVIFDTTPEAELASWLFLKYLTSPQIQAEWSQYSGYYPTRKDSLQFLQEFREENPAWASGLDLLKYSRSAPLHPSWQIVKLAVEDAFEEILASPDIDLEDQLDALDRIAAELLEWAQE
jgi:multiple sugar transport system substrate-binding protein